METTIPSGRACSVRWCDEPAGHESVHRTYAAEFVSGRASLALTIESASDRGRNRKPVLTIGSNGNVASIVLSWVAAAQLAQALSQASRRYAT